MNPLPYDILSQVCILSSISSEYHGNIRLLTVFLPPDQSLPDHLPHTTTLRVLFTRYLDINAVPRRSFFAMLHNFTSDELEREKLEEFLSLEGAVRNQVVTSPRRSPVLMVAFRLFHLG